MDLKKIVLIANLLINAVYLNGQPSNKKTTSKPIVVQQRTIEPTFEISIDGDTINRTDHLQRKQGKWLISHDSQFGEEAFMEYGTFLNNVKVGLWQTYKSNGTLQAEENFKKGNKDGEAFYYEDGKLACKAHYLGLKSNQLLDTIMVEDPITNMEKPVVIKTSVGSLRHGLWQFYDLSTRKLIREIDYQVDEIVSDKSFEKTQIDSNIAEEKKKILPHVSNKPINEAWQTDKRKKADRFTDFPENTEHVIPNVRPKKPVKK